MTETKGYTGSCNEKKKKLPSILKHERVSMETVALNCSQMIPFLVLSKICLESTSDITPYSDFFFFVFVFFIFIHIIGSQICSASTL